MSLEPTSADIAVVGAGIIGVACALQLARQGRRVVVIDAQPPGMGASYGNAGHLATFRPATGNGAFARAVG